MERAAIALDDATLSAARAAYAARDADAGLTSARRRGLLVGTLSALDFLVIAGAGLLAWAFHRPDGAVLALDYLALALASGVVCVLLIGLTGGYRWRRFDQGGAHIFHAATCFLALLAVMLAAGFVTRASGDWSRGWALAWAVGSLGGLAAGRLLCSAAARAWTASGKLRPTVAIVGDPALAARFLAERAAASEGPIALVGLFRDADEPPREPPPAGLSYGTLRELESLAAERKVDEIVLALPWSDEVRAMTLADRMRLFPARLSLAFPTQRLHRLFRTVAPDHGQILVMLGDAPLDDWQLALKRLTDIAIAASMLLVAAPVMLLTALAIKLESQGPILFRQPRYGLGNRPVEVLKFRTMYQAMGDLSGGQQTRRGDVRVTRIGKFLRSSSIDELPQLINILRGDMSIIGPRPHPIGMRIHGKLFEEIVPEYPLRHRVRPGLTGLAQVSGCRGAVHDEEHAARRVMYDLQYIERWSPWLDLKILVLTAWVVLTGKDAY